MPMIIIIIAFLGLPDNNMPSIPITRHASEEATPQMLTNVLVNESTPNNAKTPSIKPDDARVAREDIRLKPEKTVIRIPETSTIFLPGTTGFGGIGAG